MTTVLAEHKARRYEPADSAFQPHGRNAKFIEWVGCDKRVLELGCSSGFISKYLTARNCSVTGIERDPDAAAIAKEHCNKVIVADLNSNWHEMISEKFDVIALGDVLEHLLDPLSVLRACGGLLDQKGRIVVSVPNVAFLHNRLHLLFGRWDYTDTGILDRTHTRFFTLKTARQLIREAGYVIEAFHPVAGMRGSTRFPTIAQALTDCMPGLLGYQFLFSAKIA